MPRFGKQKKTSEPRKSNAGRKPKPTNLHVLNGNPSKIDLKERAAKEPKYTPLAPDCPDWLSDDAKAEWDRLLPELDRAGLLARVDMAAFAGYCDSYAMWKKASDEITANRGLTVDTMQGIKAHPAVAIREKALASMKAFAVEFGFTPAARCRVQVPEQEKQNDGSDLLSG